MDRSANQVTLFGNVGHEPDIYQTQNGTKAAHLSMATTCRITGGGEDGEEATDWHRITQFVEEHVSAGGRVYIEGGLEYGFYERDGVTIPTVEITVRELAMLSSKEVPAGVGGRVLRTVPEWG